MWRKMFVLVLAVTLGGCYYISNLTLFKMVSDDVPLTDGAYTCVGSNGKKSRMTLKRISVAGGSAFQLTAVGEKSPGPLVFRKVGGDRYLAVFAPSPGEAGQGFGFVRIRDDRVDILQMAPDHDMESAHVADEDRSELKGNADSQRAFLKEVALQKPLQVLAACRRS